MKTFCKAFGYWLWHPEDTGILCQNRALKLQLPQCISCLGVEISEKTELIDLPAQESDPIPEPFPDYELLEWIKGQNMAELGRMLGVNRFVVKRWVDRGRIPKKYRELALHLQNVHISANGNIATSKKCSQIG